MGVDLQDVLIKYKECTLQIIRIIEEDNFDMLGELIQSRQEIVDEALECTFDKVEGKRVYKELGLNEIQEKLNILMSSKLEGIRSEMDKIAKSKRANNSYNKRYTSATIFSKKIWLLKRGLSLFFCILKYYKLFFKNSVKW